MGIIKAESSPTFQDWVRQLAQDDGSKPNIALDMVDKVNQVLLNNIKAVYNTAVIGANLIELGTGADSTQRVGVSNSAAGDFSATVSGSNNTANGDFAFVGGGTNNRTLPSLAPTTTADYSAIVGGRNNFIASPGCFIGGGLNNSITTQAFPPTSSDYAAITGGRDNTILGPYAFIGGGYLNSAGGKGSAILGGYKNGTNTNAPYGCVAGGLENTTGAGVGGFIGGGASNYILISPHCAILGGYDNSIQSISAEAAIVGGNKNKIHNRSEMSVVIGGYKNQVGAGARKSFVGGGGSNMVYGHYTSSHYADYSAIVCGDNNIISGTLLHTAYNCFIGGGSSNSIEATDGSSIVGGEGNTIPQGATRSFIGGGSGNYASGIYTAVVCGLGNKAEGWGSFVGSGEDNFAYGSGGIVNGWCNEIDSSSWASFIGGGYYNKIQSSGYGAIIGGYNVVLTGDRSCAWGCNVGGAITVPLDDAFVVATGSMALGIPASFGGGSLTLAIMNGTTPTAGIADGSLIYSKDVLGQAHLHTMDEAGNETQLGSHNLDGEWEFYSRNVNTGKVTRVNMERAMRILEGLSGEKIIYEE